MALALEGTVASDTPGLKLPANVTPTTQGRGPEIRLMDKDMISERGLADFLVRVAPEASIPHQMIVILNSGPAGCPPCGAFPGHSIENRSASLVFQCPL
jgi:putative aminopeptidase FrvX